MRSLPTEAPSLHRSYPASSVLRASPPPQTARPGSRELPVDPQTAEITEWRFPCCVRSSTRTCHRQYPGKIDGTHSLVPSHRLRPSPENWRVGSCITRFEACSTFTHVMACTLAKTPSRPSTPKAPTASLPLPPLRLLPGGANQFPGGSVSRCGPAPFHGAQLSSSDIALAWPRIIEINILISNITSLEAAMTTELNSS